MSLPDAKIEDFPLRTYEKLRYVDTDRQGHVNNAVFSSMLETGRVELLYGPDDPLASEGCSFVIARLVLDFKAQISWPGRIEIGTRVAEIGRSSMTLEQGLFQEGRCAAIATTVIVHVDDASARSAPLSGSARKVLEALRAPSGS